MVSTSDVATTEYEIRENRYKLGRILKNFDNTQGPIRNVLDHIVNVVRPTTKIEEPYAVKTLKHLIKNTKKRDILSLWEAVCNENPQTPCVIYPIPKTDVTDVGAQMKMMPHVFFVKMLRNPDVLTHHELRPVRHCTRPFQKNAKVTECCINPWHYTIVATGLVQNNKTPRVWVPTVRQPFDAARPAFNGYASEKFDHDALCSPGGVPNATIEEAPAGAPDAQSPTTSEAAEPMDTTQLIEVKYSHPDYWCDIIYYELNQRIGHKFSARASSIIVDGFTSPTDEDRFCLGQLNNINRDKATLEARKNIGKGRGIRLYSINGEVFIESLCENSVFVQSPNTNMRLGYHPATVCKVPRGVSLMIFNMKQFEKMFSEAVERGYEAVYALMRMCVLRISFVKGWGSNYRRSNVTMTPCWIEVYLRGPLEWLDMALTQMAPPHLQCSSNT